MKKCRLILGVCVLALMLILSTGLAWADVAPQNLGNGGAKWEIENGVLRIYSASGSGRISQINSDINGNASPDKWPWYNYRDQITSVEIVGSIGTYPNVDLTYMFSGLSQATKIDLSGLTQESNNNSNTTRSLKGMFSGCSSLTEIIGLEKLNSTRTNNTSEMFNGCSALETIDDIGSLQMSNVSSMKSMFAGCTSLTSLDLSSFENAGKVYEMQDMFNGCTNLQKVILNNANFQTRPSGNGGVQMQRMFERCTNLKVVDFSYISIGGRDGWTQVNGLFKNNTSIETVILENTNLSTVSNLSSMFEGCKSLTNVEMAGVKVDDAEYMTNMFNGCTALKELDVSSFGKLENIVNMDGFVQGCTNLQTLILDNLDNSRIGPTNNRHWISEGYDNLLLRDENGNPIKDNKGNDISIGASEFGRDLGLKSCTSLVTLSAKDSKVWMVNNNRGLPGSEYYQAANESDLYYFTKKKMKRRWSLPRTGKVKHLLTLKPSAIILI